MYGGFFKITKLSVLGQITEKKTNFRLQHLKTCYVDTYPGRGPRLIF